MEFGIVYSKNTGRIRSIVVPENENEQHILDLVNLNNGEALIKMKMEEFDYDNILQDKLNKITGLKPKDDRFAIINEESGRIEGIIFADEKIDNIDGKKLIKSNMASIGWKYNKGKFEK